MSASPPHLLWLRLEVDYPGRPRLLSGVELAVWPGEVLALVGKSGSGKSTLALAILRLLDMHGGCVRGEIWFQGENLLKKTESEMRRIRGRAIGLVLQSPMSALNPVMRVGAHLKEAWRAHAAPEQARDWRRRAWEVLEQVRLPAREEFLRLYPRELSVGLAQRVLIALAILHRPALLIADEPTTALDVITQSEVLGLFAELNRALRMAILYISHDLLAVASLSHRVAILEGGRIVETAATSEIFARPAHEFTRRLLVAMPQVPEFAAG